MHLWTINWVLFSDIHIQNCVPQNFDLICGLVFISYVGYYQSPTTPVIHNCFRQKSVHLHLPKAIFTFKTAVVMVVRAGHNFKWSSCWQLHRHTLKGIENPNHMEKSPYLQNILAIGWTLSSHKNEMMRLLLSKLWCLQHAQSAW